MIFALRVACCALVSFPATAQQLGTGTVGGTVSRTQSLVRVRITGTVERDGIPAPDVTVSTDAAVTQTDAQGAFELTPIVALGGRLLLTAATRIAGVNWRASASFPVSASLSAGALVLQAHSIPLPFAPPVAPYTGPLACGDFDGDADLDFVVGQGSTDLVLVRNSAGGFEGALQTTGLRAAELRTVDLDVDGDLDLVIRHSVAGLDRWWSAVRNDGSGVFAAPQTIGEHGWRAAIADFDGDGAPDFLAVVSGTLAFRRGRGDGTFEAPLVQSGPPGDVLVTASDFDQDGRPDLALAAASTVTVALGNGDGTFVLLPSNPLAHASSRLVDGDFDGDGAVDLVALTYTVPPGASVYWYYAEPLRGGGDGTFVAAPVFRVSNSTLDLRLADLDLDADADLLAQLGYSGTVSEGSLEVWTSTGDGTFASAAVHTIGSWSSPPFVEDFDEDGVPDVIVEGGPGIVVLLGQGDGTLEVPLALAATQDVTSAADYDADGDLDLLRMDYGDGTVQLSRNSGSAVFTSIGPAAAVAHPLLAASGDLDGDSDLDVVVGHDTSVTVLANAALRLTPGASYSSLSNPVPGLADFDRDGDLDLAVSSWGGVGQLHVYPGNGNGTFGTRTPWPIGGQGRSLVVGDWNADLAPDVAVQTQSPLQVAVRLGNGDGTFQGQTTYPTNGRFFGPQSACDVDGDGALDLVTSHEVLLGHGDGGFDPALALGIRADGVAELDGDALPDLVRTSNGLLEVFSGSGDGTFGEARWYLAPYDPFTTPRPLLDDFDGDGDRDAMLVYGYAALLRGRRVP